jgi:chitinase
MNGLAPLFGAIVVLATVAVMAAATAAATAVPRPGSTARLDVLNYAFANVAPDADGNVVCKLADEWADYQVPWTADQSVTGEAVTWPRPILGNFQQLQALKTLYPSLKVVSLGGWTFSKYFSDAALTDA